MIVSNISNPLKLFNVLMAIYSEERHREALQALVGLPQDFKRYVGMLEEKVADSLLDAGSVGEADALLHEYWEHFRDDDSTQRRSCFPVFACIAGGFATSGFLVSTICGPLVGVMGAVIGGFVISNVLTHTCQGEASRDRGSLLADAYKALGLPMEADIRRVREKYVDLAKKHHPEKGQGKSKFIELSAAYETIRAERMPEGRSPLLA